MRTGSLIGFTEAELALILVVVFAIVLPNLPDGKDNGSAKTPVDMATFKASQDSLARVRDSLRLTRAKLDSLMKRGQSLQDSVTRLRLVADGAKAEGVNRAPYDPECSLLKIYHGPARPVGEIRIVEAGYLLDGAILSLDGLATRISGYTDQAEQLRCKFPMTVVVSASLPAGRLEKFRERFQRRYYVRARVKD